MDAIIYVEPTPKGRPKSTIVQGRVRTYTPAKTRNAEQLIIAMIRTQVMKCDFYAHGCPLRLIATFYRGRPKFLPKKITMPVQRPDLDNYTKLLTDALEGYVYANDSQIVTLVVKKRFGQPPRIELSIEAEG